MLTRIEIRPFGMMQAYYSFSFFRKGSRCWAGILQSGANPRRLLLYVLIGSTDSWMSASQDLLGSRYYPASEHKDPERPCSSLLEPKSLVFPRLDNSPRSPSRPRDFITRTLKDLRVPGGTSASARCARRRDRVPSTSCRPQSTHQER